MNNKITNLFWIVFLLMFMAAGAETARRIIVGTGDTIHFDTVERLGVDDMADTGLVGDTTLIWCDFGTTANKVCEGDDARIPTTDEKAAMTGANSPSAANVFATMDDVDADSPVWGNITGTLANQTDLQDALDDKVDLADSALHQHVEADITDLDKYTQAEVATLIAAADTGVQTATGGDFLTNSGTEDNPILDVDVDDSSTANIQLWTAEKITSELGLKQDVADSALFIWKDGSQDFTADQSLAGFNITNSDEPTADSELATKYYVDNNAGGNIKDYDTLISVGSSGCDYTDLSDAYDYAKTLLPTSTNRLCLYVFPGTYTENITMDTDYIDFVGVDRYTSVITSATGFTITKTVGNILIDNLTIESTRGADGGNTDGAINETTAGSRTDSFVTNCILKSTARHTVYNGRSLYQNCTVLNTLNDSDARCFDDTGQGQIMNCYIDCTYARGINSLKCNILSSDIRGGTYGITVVSTSGYVYNCYIYGAADGIYQIQSSRYVSGSYIQGGVNGYPVRDLDGFIYNSYLRSQNDNVGCINTVAATTRISNCYLENHATSTYCIDNPGTKVKILGANIGSNKPFPPNVVVTSSELDIVQDRINLNAWKERRFNAFRIGGYPNMIDGFTNDFTVEDEGMDTTLSDTYLYDADGDYYYQETGTAAGGNDANTLFLCHFNGNDGDITATDSAVGGGHAITRNGDAVIDDAQYKWTTSSLTDGTGDYWSLADSAVWDFGTGAFCVDFQVRLSSVAANQGLVDIGGYQTGVFIYYEQGNTNIEVYVKNSLYQFDQTLSVDTWYHILVSRSGTNLRCFVDGTQIGITETDSSDVTGLTSGVYIGNMQHVDLGVVGWMDEVRISNVARQTANFTKPSVEYSTSGAGGVDLGNMELYTEYYQIGIEPTTVKAMILSNAEPTSVELTRTGTGTSLTAGVLSDSDVFDDTYYSFNYSALVSGESSDTCIRAEVVTSDSTIHIYGISLMGLE